MSGGNGTKILVPPEGPPEMRGLMRRHIDLPGLRWHRIEPGLSGDPGLAPFRS
jgi:hypothetical protein